MGLPVRQDETTPLAKRSWDLAWRETKEATLNDTGYAVAAVVGVAIIALTAFIQGGWAGLIPGLLATAIVLPILFVAVLISKWVTAPVRVLQGDISALKTHHDSIVLELKRLHAEATALSQTNYSALESRYSELSNERDALLRDKESERPILKVTSGRAYCEYSVFEPNRPQKIAVHLAVRNSGHPTSVGSWLVGFAKDGKAVEAGIRTAKHPFDILVGGLDNSYTINPSELIAVDDTDVAKGGRKTGWLILDVPTGWDATGSELVIAFKDYLETAYIHRVQVDCESPILNPGLSLAT